MRAAMNLQRAQQRAQQTWEFANEAQIRAEAGKQMGQQALASNRAKLVELNKLQEQNAADFARAANDVRANFGAVQMDRQEVQEEALQHLIVTQIQRKAQSKGSWEETARPVPQQEAAPEAMREFEEASELLRRRAEQRKTRDAFFQDEERRPAADRRAYRGLYAGRADRAGKEIREVAALSIRFDLPDGGQMFHFRKEGRKADLAFRSVSRSWDGTGSVAFKVLALMGIFIVSLRLGWLRKETAWDPAGGLRLLFVVVVVGVLLSNSLVALVILGLAVVFLVRSWRQSAA
jgi:hypothetical protein